MDLNSIPILPSAMHFSYSFHRMKTKQTEKSFFLIFPIDTSLYGMIHDPCKPSTSGTGRNST